MCEETRIPAKTVVSIALAAEGLLAMVGLYWIWLRDLPPPVWNKGWGGGILAALPLLVLNFMLLEAARRGKWPPLDNLLKEAIRPICCNLGPCSGGLVALAAGLGEEIFFRGALNVELSRQLGDWAGIATASLAFAALHFVGQIRRYYQLIILYFGIGVYLSVLASWHESLASAVACHAFYDYMAILYIRYGLSKCRNGRPE